MDIATPLAQTRAEMHRLVDAIPDDRIQDARSLIVAYRDGDQFEVQRLTAPLVDPEPEEITALAELTEEDRRAALTLEEYMARRGL